MVVRAAAVPHPDRRAGLKRDLGERGGCGAERARRAAARRWRERLERAHSRRVDHQAGHGNPELRDDPPAEPGLGLVILGARYFACGLPTAWSFG